MLKKPYGHVLYATVGVMLIFDVAISISEHYAPCLLDPLSRARLGYLTGTLLALLTYEYLKKKYKL